MDLVQLRNERRIDKGGEEGRKESEEWPRPKGAGCVVRVVCIYRERGRMEARKENQEQLSRSALARVP